MKRDKKRARKQFVREGRKRLLGRAGWTKLAQADFNRFIRERDAGQSCISCNATSAKWDAGHYRTTGAAPELRFSELNCHKQCAQCNRNKSGNLVEYRINLVARIGQEAVDYLEGPHDPKKYTIDELKEIRATYRAKWKELRAAKE